MSPLAATATSVGLVKSNFWDVSDSLPTFPIWYRIFPFRSVLYTRAPSFGWPLGAATFSVQYRYSWSPSFDQYRPWAVAVYWLGSYPILSWMSLVHVSRILPAASKMTTQAFGDRDVTQMRSLPSTTTAQPNP